MLINFWFENGLTEFGPLWYEHATITSLFFYIQCQSGSTFGEKSKSITETPLAHNGFSPFPKMCRVCNRKKNDTRNDGKEVSSPSANAANSVSETHKCLNDDITKEHRISGRENFSRSSEVNSVVKATCEIENNGLVMRDRNSNLYSLQSQNSNTSTVSGNTGNKPVGTCTPIFKHAGNKVPEVKQAVQYKQRETNSGSSSEPKSVTSVSSHDSFIEQRSKSDVEVPGKKRANSEAKPLESCPLCQMGFDEG